MKHTLSILLFTVNTIATSIAFADSRPDHYTGKPAASVAQALANLNTYNKELESLLSKELTPEAMNNIHQISYTLENALELIAKELKTLQQDLEEVHLGSEDLEQPKVSKHGARYLKRSAELFGDHN